jgi:lysophospholipase L1-like esterase
LTLGVTSRTVPVGPSLLASVEGYAPKLARLLALEFGGDLSLINSGIGAEGTESGSDRFSAETRVYKPDLVLLLEGVVDVNNPRPRFDVARKNLREMMRTANGRRIPLIIGTVPPLNPQGFRTRGAENVPVLNDIIRQLAAEEGVPVADHEEAFGGDLSLQGPDGLHPNSRGYEVMAETWFQAIVALMT